MPLPEEFARLLSASAPGLVFAEHKAAGAPQRAYATPHRLNGPPSRQALRELRRLTRGSPPFSTLDEFYAEHDGGRLFTLWDELNEGEVGALELLPIDEWDEATRPYSEGDRAWLLEGCELYERGTWQVIGRLPSEETCIVGFFDGDSDGRPLAGRLFSVSLDPVLDCEEELAPDFASLLADLGRDPVAWFRRIGFGWYVRSPDGVYFGDPVADYTEDVRRHPNLTPWPR